MITELRPSLISFCTSLIARYHQLENLLIEAGAMEFNPNLWKILYHTCLAKAELTLLLDHKVGKQPDEEVLSWQDEHLSNNGCSLQVK
jgi:hypothetical protein